MNLLKVALNPAGYLIEQVNNNNLEVFIGKKSTIQELKEDALREEIKAGVMQNLAKVEQELAIARRIENAEEVEIEEYYDVSGKGNVGVKGTAETVTVGASGEGRKVTKRIIKFKGFSVTQIPE
ncbi:MAG: hypothetical protein NWQ54_13245 [Paraglaciecola sp.]|nr:hypothetical protein [Paraglaciecola sp.]